MKDCFLALPHWKPQAQSLQTLQQHQGKVCVPQVKPCGPKSAFQWLLCFKGKFCPRPSPRGCLAHWEQGGCEHSGVWNPQHRRGAHRAPAGFVCRLSMGRRWATSHCRAPFSFLPRDTVVQLLILLCKTSGRCGSSSKIQNLITFSRSESYKAQPRFLPADNMSGNIMHKGL